MTHTAQPPRARAASRALVGREGELTRLWSIYEEVAGDHGLATVLMEGPAGIGKSRVVTELTAQVRQQGGDVLIGRCVVQGEQVLPYAPVAEMLADLVRREGGPAVLQWAGHAGRELARLVPALVPDSDAAEATRASAAKLFQAMCALLESLSSRRPTVVVIEDLQWADRSTRELLALLAHQLRGRVLVLLTLRTDESPRDPGIARLTAELGRRGEHRLELRSLTRDEQAHQMSDILGVPPRRELVDDVYARAEGNPFFAEELRALGRSDALPTTVRALLLARLDTLPPATRQVLRTAAVVGREVPHLLLDAVSDVATGRLEEALRPAVDTHVLTIEAGAYRFRHALLQEAVASTLLPGEAARMHRRVAEALTTSPELGGSPRFVAGQVARHWYAAGDAARALDASIAAAHEAKNALAFSESLSHYERAIELLETVPDADTLLEEPRYWLLGLQRRKGVWCRCDAASVLLQLGRLGEALALLDDAVALDPQGVDRFRSDLSRGQVLTRLGRFDEAREALERAHRAGDRLLDGQLVGPLYAALVELAAWQGDSLTAEAWADEGAGRMPPSEDASFAVPVFAAAVFALVNAKLVAPGRDLTGALGTVDEWLGRSADAIARTPASTPIAVAHAAAARCERARLSGMNHPQGWADVIERWDAIGDSYRASYARIRYAEALLRARSGRKTAEETLRSAWATAAGMGSQHLVDLAGYWPNAQVWGSPTHPIGESPTSSTSPRASARCSSWSRRG